MSVSSRTKFAPRPTDASAAESRNDLAELPLTRVQIVLRLPDLSYAPQASAELVEDSIECDAPAEASRVVAAHAPVVVETVWEQDTHSLATYASAASTSEQSPASHLPELGRQAAAAVEQALRGGRWARWGALVGSWGGLLIRPETRWLLAAAGMARAAATIRSSRRAAASDKLAKMSKPATAAATEEHTKLVGLMQSLAQPNALVAAVLALACVLLAVLVQGNRQQPASEPATAVAKGHEDWNAELAEAVVEPNAAVAPPFAAAPPAVALTDKGPLASEVAPPPLEQQPPTPPQPSQAPLPRASNPKRPPSPHAARRHPPTAGVNEPLSLPGSKTGVGPPGQAEQRPLRVFPRRETDRYGMPVTAPAAELPLSAPLEPPSIEAPPGGFDALGPQAVYPVRDTSLTRDLAPPVQAAAPIYVAERTARPGTESRGARLRGIIQPQAAP